MRLGWGLEWGWGSDGGCIPIYQRHGKYSHSKYSLTIFRGRVSMGCGEECVTWVGLGPGWRTGTGACGGTCVGGDVVANSSGSAAWALGLIASDGDEAEAPSAGSYGERATSLVRGRGRGRGRGQGQGQGQGWGQVTSGPAWCARSPSRGRAPRTRRRRAGRWPTSLPAGRHLPPRSRWARERSPH